MKFTVSPSPHVYAKDSVKSIMWGVVFAMFPALLLSFYSFGIGAVITSLVAVASCLAFEFLIQKYLLKEEPKVADGSAVLTGILLAFNLPSSIPSHLVIIGSLVAIGMGKMSFGGLGNNIFNPALVGRVFLLISFPVDMTLWPKAFENQTKYFDAATGATPLGIVKEGLANGEPVSSLMAKIPSISDMFIGFMPGSLGEVSGLLLIIGGIYMLYKKIITWHIPVSVLGSMFVFAFILNAVKPEAYAGPMFHIVAGGALLGAIFMATDMVTSPMNARGQIIFGIGIGVLTMLIRVFGAYPEGVSFAILIMNAFVPIINKYVKPKRFGEATKN